ncbi:YXWGXW repeat-containing protein [Acidovorax delafieldii]|uniref:YXWGXW repeat-containing protein n=1 Tax=Acidovorax delafieldii TaxID=47920 RepID=A0A561XC52_ACIDE|nr:YXWGXW repeat-containing protein [Acidovorax delafieldii]TWG33693.1 YXWGXW repeat-containing protein [Acidovorax delafieldii]
MARHPLTAASLALMAFLAFAPAQAATQGTVIIQSGQPERGYQTAPTYQVIPAPPPPRNEAMPRPRRGQVWEEGHWEWRGNRHHWVRGHWVQARNGYQYRQPQWIEREGRWEMQRGGWDRDGDGISNRNDRDRDGDGVPNRRDSQQDNPRRN